MARSPTAGPIRTASMNTLPDEILLDIFTILRNSSSLSETRGLKAHASQIWDWVALTHVCRSWRIAALHAPQLWSYIHYFTNRKKTKAFLERSGNMELTVYARIPKVEGLDDDGVIGERSFRGVVGCLKMVLQNLDRIHHLNLLVNYSVDVTKEWVEILKLLDRPAPRLQTLSFGGTPDLATLSLRFPDFSNVAPLRTINFTDSIVDHHITLLNLAGLVELNLVNTVGLWPQDFIALFNSCPDLEVLRIREVDWIIGGTYTLGDKTVSLPKLTFLGLHFRENYEKWDDELFRRLVVPDSISWQCFYEYKKDKSILDFKTFTGLCKRDLNCEELLMTLNRHGLRIRSQNLFGAAESDGRTSIGNASSSDLELDWGVDKAASSVIPHVESLITGCYWKTAKTFTLNLHQGYNFEAHHWVSLLLCLPFVEFLEIAVEKGSQDDESKNGDILAFLEALTYRCRSPVSESAAVCPMLRHLSLEWDPDEDGRVAELLEKGLRNRKEMGLGPKKLTLSTKCRGEKVVHTLSNSVEELIWKDTDCYRSQYYLSLYSNPSFRDEREDNPAD